MNTLNENWELFCSKLEQVKHNKNGIAALCPSHNDKKPSLSASYTEEKILVNCQAGCSFDNIVSVLGMNQSQFFAPKETSILYIVARYSYEKTRTASMLLTLSVLIQKILDHKDQMVSGLWKVLQKSHIDCHRC